MELVMTLVNLDRETVRHGNMSLSPGLMVRMKDFVANRRAVRQLHQLDDRMLSDIGINRGEINNRIWGR